MFAEWPHGDLSLTSVRHVYPRLSSQKDWDAVVDQVFMWKILFEEEHKIMLISSLFQSFIISIFVILVLLTLVLTVKKKSFLLYRLRTCFLFESL